MRWVVLILGGMLVALPCIPTAVFTGYALEGLYKNDTELLRGIGLSGVAFFGAFVLWTMFAALVRPQDGAPPTKPGSIARILRWAALVTLSFGGSTAVLAFAQERLEPVGYGGQKSPLATVALAIELVALVPMVFGIREVARWTKTPSSVSVSGLRFGCLGILLLPFGAGIALAATRIQDDRTIVAFWMTIGIVLSLFALAMLRISLRRFFPPNVTTSSP